MTGYVLSERMEMVLGLLDAAKAEIAGNEGFKRLADVGCDHAYVSMEAVKRGIARHAIAMDVRRGPLDIAKKNISEEKLEGMIEARLSDGLFKVSPGEVDAVIIAGMGGRLMCEILKKGKDVLRDVNVLVLQPQSEADELRKTVMEMGFSIVEERMVFDAGKYYMSFTCVSSDAIFSLSKSGECRGRKIADINAPYSFLELLYGRWNVIDKPEIFIDYLDFEKKNLELALSKIKESGNADLEKTALRIKEIEESLAMNRKAAGDNMD